MSTGRHEFASDNTAGICPEAWLALKKANAGAASSYGEDDWTARLRARVDELFEHDCGVFLVFNGTAANALALAQITRSYQSVICHEQAHIENDECGACEFYSSGGKLIPTSGSNGKLDLQEVKAALTRQRELHSHQPRVLSLTQATELGTIYTPAEVKNISGFARERDLLVHMDGARFANAVSALSCAPREISWQAGVDVLCLGGTKNGLATGELVIFFNSCQAEQFDYRMKQAGQLASKMRLLAAPWLGLFESGAWLKNAACANTMAKTLGEKLRAAGAKLAWPVEANAVFLRCPAELVERLHSRGWRFHKFIEPDIYRLMCAWSTPLHAVDEFVEAYRAADVCAPAAA